MQTTTRYALRGLVALRLLAGPSPLLAAPTGEVVGTVRVQKPGGAPVDPSGVVVYLEGVPEAPPAETERPHPQVHQRDLQFTPSLMVVVKGTTVDFPNDDKVFHNVFSFSEAAKFDLGLYKSGTSKSVTFRRPGVINLYCNIHPDMLSKIKVLDTSYYSVVSKDGAFRVANVPPGSYPLVAWQSYGPEFHGQVTVTSAGTAALSITMTVGEPDTRHLRKDGTPYGRYK
jgi:plastocyanin